MKTGSMGRMESTWCQVENPGRCHTLEVQGRAELMWHEGWDCHPSRRMGKSPEVSGMLHILFWWWLFPWASPQMPICVTCLELKSCSGEHLPTVQEKNTKNYIL